MKRSYSLIAAAGLLASVTACDSIKEAFTAHVDVVARVGSQELSTERLGAMIGNSTIPVQPEVVKAVADLWLNYQLVALAAARGDSLNDPKLVDEAMWAQISQLKARRYFTQVSAEFAKSDTAGLEARYGQGELLAAQHILFAVPEQGLSARAVDSIKRVAESVRAQANAGNFASLAAKYSMDPGSAQRGGALGVFPTKAMVPEFEQGLLVLKPGEISPSLVQSQFGFHIIRRPIYSEVSAEFAEAIVASGEQRAEQAYYEKLESENKVVVKGNVAPKVNEIARDPSAFLSDKTTLATTRRSSLTGGRLAKWIQAFPPQSQIAQTLAQADSATADNFVKAMVRNELLVAKADEAKIKPDSAELADVRAGFRIMVVTAWSGLGVEPTALGDSAKTGAEKERLVAGRVDDFIDRLLKTGGQGYVDVPQQLADALRVKYSARVNPAGIERAAERAKLVRAALDSANARGTGRGGAPAGGPVSVPVPPGAVPSVGR